MSLAGVHPVDLHPSRSSLLSFSHSLDDITGLGLNWSPQAHHQHYHHHNLSSDQVVTIEELRLELTTCFTCGVSWNDSHVSLDCSECGGYALERPCPECEGTCGAVWKRDLSMSHDCSKAKWFGECANKRQSKTISEQAQELSTRLEKLSANS